ncbi:MAG: tetratricopeptide repeat protein [Saprospiraceae bacterium]|nr:tetratricopeptide repeat protein [Saprospiraceae bacterium]
MAKEIFRRFFGKQVAGILTEVHLVPELRARILDKLDNAPLEDNILFTDSQLHASKEDLLSALLTLLIADAEEINETVPVLLTHVETHFERLSDFHQGVYWHLKGYLAWRNDRSHYHAMAYLNRSHKILKGSGLVVSDYYRARVYDTMGQISYHLGHMEEAIEDFTLAISLRPPDLDSYGRALTYGSLGRVHMDLGNYDDAIEFLRRDLEIMRSDYPQMTQIQTQLLSNLGLCHRENQQLDQAEKHYQESLTFAKNSQHAISLFFAYVGLGKIAVYRKNLEQATAWEDKAVSTFQAKIPDAQLEIKGNLKHLSAQIAMLRGDLKAAASYFKKGLKYYQSSKFTSPTELASFLLDYAQVTTQL